MNHPAVGIAVLLLISGGLGALGWLLLREFSSKFKDD